jgi:hypothetical protein
VVSAKPFYAGSKTALIYETRNGAWLDK